MKGIPIKFRAKETIKGEYVYGDLIHCGDDVCIREHTTVDLFLTHEGDTKVDPDSVAQLLGYDVDGAEIYEGDEIENTDLLTGKTFCVKAGYCGINYAHFNFKLAGGNDE